MVTVAGGMPVVTKASDSLIASLNNDQGKRMRVVRELSLSVRGTARRRSEPRSAHGSEIEPHHSSKNFRAVVPSEQRHISASGLHNWIEYRDNGTWLAYGSFGNLFGFPRGSRYLVSRVAVLYQ